MMNAENNFGVAMLVGDIKLHHTSALFSTVVAHAFWLRLAVYHHVFLMLTVSSLLFHTLHDPLMRLIDKGLAHAIFALVLCDTRLALEIAPWVLIFPAGAAFFWFAQSFWPDQSETLHALLHLCGVLGMHVYFYFLYMPSYS